MNGIVSIDSQVIIRRGEERMVWDNKKCACSLSLVPDAELLKSLEFPKWGWVYLLLLTSPFYLPEFMLKR